MSFGAEMRDFTSAMTGTIDAYDKLQDAEWRRRNKGAPVFNPTKAGKDIDAGGTGNTAGDDGGDEDRFSGTPVGFVRDSLKGLFGTTPTPAPAVAPALQPVSITPPVNNPAASIQPTVPTLNSNRGGMVTRAGNRQAIPTQAFAFGGSVTGGRVGARPLPRAYSPSPAMQSAVPATVAGGGPVAAAGMPIMARRFQDGGPVDPNDVYPGEPEVVPVDATRLPPTEVVPVSATRLPPGQYDIPGVVNVDQVTATRLPPTEVVPVSATRLPPTETSTAAATRLPLSSATPTANVGTPDQAAAGITPTTPNLPATTPAQPAPTTAGAPPVAQPPVDTSPAAVPPPASTPVAAAIPTTPTAPMPTATTPNLPLGPPPDTPKDEKPTDAEREASEHSTLGDALHGAITYLQKFFGIDQAVPGGAPNADGTRRLMSGEGAFTPAEVHSAARAIDPNGELTDDVRNIRILNAGYRFYLMHGDVAKANQYAASMVQYVVGQASQYGQDAVNALLRGDIHSAVGYLQRANNELPTNQNVESVNDSDPNKIELDQKDAKTGKITHHTISPQDLYGLAMGLANRSGAWQAILGAASTVKDANVPESDAEKALRDKISGGGAAAPAAGAAAAPGAPGAPNPAYAPHVAVTSLPTTVTPDVQKAFDSIPDQYKPLAMNVAAGESHFSANPDQTKNPSVAGLFQFTVPTWKQVTGQDIPAADQGVVGKDPRLDPMQAAQAFVKYSQQNQAYLEKVMGRPATPGEIALMHQQGPGGAVALLRADPGSSALDAMMQQRMAVGQKPETARANAMAALARNGVNPKATAAQALQHIEGYYGYDSTKGGSPLAALPTEPDQGAAPVAAPAPAAAPGAPPAKGVTPAGKPGAPPPELTAANTMPAIGTTASTAPADSTPTERAMHVRNPLQQDMPKIPPQPTPPQLIQLTADDFQGIPADRAAAYQKAADDENKRRATAYQEQVTEWNNQIKALKDQGQLGAPKPLSRKDNDTFVKDINELAPPKPAYDADKKRVPSAIDAIWTNGKGESAWDIIGSNNQGVVRDLANGLADYNPSITAEKALQVVHMMAYQPKGGTAFPYAINRIPEPDGSVKAYRITAADGEQFIMGADKLGELQMLRGDIGKKTDDKIKGDKAAAAAADAEAKLRGKFADSVISGLENPDILPQVLPTGTSEGGAGPAALWLAGRPGDAGAPVPTGGPASAPTRPTARPAARPAAPPPIPAVRPRPNPLRVAPPRQPVVAQAIPVPIVPTATPLSGP